MMCCSIQLRNQIFVKGYDYLLLKMWVKILVKI